MKKSEHRYIDRYGYRCAVEIICEDDEIVVFDSTPKLSFDYKKHGIKIKREKFDDYVITYVMKNGNLFFRSFLAPLSFLSRKGQIFGVTPEPYFDGKFSIYKFGDIPTEYLGTLSIGKDFDFRYWNHDEKSSPVPFLPEAYKENGYIKIEQGKIVEFFLEKREK